MHCLPSILLLLLSPQKVELYMQIFTPREAHPQFYQIQEWQQGSPAFSGSCFQSSCTSNLATPCASWSSALPLPWALSCWPPK